MNKREEIYFGSRNGFLCYKFTIYESKRSCHSSKSLFCNRNYRSFTGIVIAAWSYKLYKVNQPKEAKVLGLICHLLSLFFSEIQTGLPVMTETSLVALKLPLKIIAYEDDQNKVWFAYNEAKYIEERRNNIFPTKFNRHKMFQWNDLAINISFSNHKMFSQNRKIFRNIMP